MDVRLVSLLGLSRRYPCFPAKLNQVILNLVNDAIDASDRGSSASEGHAVHRTSENT